MHNLAQMKCTENVPLQPLREPHRWGHSCWWPISDFSCVGGQGQVRDDDLEEINVEFLTSKWSGKIHTNYMV